MTYYTAAEVWAGYERHRQGVERVVMPNPDPAHIARGVIVRARRLIRFDLECYIRVGVWQRYRSRGGKLGWEDWYARRPILKCLYEHEEPTREYPDLAAVRLTEALDAYRRATGSGLSLRVAQKAILRGTLEAWRPRGGQWYTTVECVRVWRESCLS